MRGAQDAAGRSAFERAGESQPPARLQAFASNTVGGSRSPASLLSAARRMCEADTQEPSTDEKSAQLTRSANWPAYCSRMA